MISDGHDFDKKEVREIDFDTFVRLIAEQKKHQSVSNEEDTLDAFVALGGQDDRGGFIDAQKLIDIVKNEF